MKAHFELKSILQNVNWNEPASYKKIVGEYLFNDYTLVLDNIEKDTSNISIKARVKISNQVAGFPEDTFSNRSREIALRDFIARILYAEINSSDSQTKDNVKRAYISLEKPGQEIIDRTSVLLDDKFVEIRFKIVLCQINQDLISELSEDIIFNDLADIIENTCIYNSLNKNQLYKHIETSEDADFLRAELENLRLIAFVAQGSLLPRETGDNDFPCKSNDILPFSSPNNLKMDVELPNGGQITGMGIPRGITFIAGPKGSGKTTLLDAIGQGIYNHVPGDGREFVVSNPNSVNIRSEPGRNISGVNISGFIDNLEDDSNISTENGNSDISIAANIVEAIEVGADVVLIDNIFISEYIAKSKSIFNEYMVSTILSSDTEISDYYSLANFILRIDNYTLEDITQAAKDSCSNYEGYSPFGYLAERIPIADSMEALDINLESIDQIISKSQEETILDAVNYSKKYMDGKKSFRQVTSLVMLDIGRLGLDVLNPDLAKNYSEFRKIELAAALNRIKSLKVEHK